MYEMEGASNSSSANSPIARPAGNRGARRHHPAEPQRTPVDSVPATQKGASPGRPHQLGKPCRERWAPNARLRELPGPAAYCRATVSGDV